MTEPDGFDDDAHDLYVQGGGCEYVEDKTYCNGEAGHAGDHWAPFLEPGGRTRRVPLRRARPRRGG